MEQGLAIEVTGLETRFGQAVIHHNLNLAVKRAEIMALVGGSGTGKSVLLRNIVGLMTPYAGKIEVLGELPSAMSPRERHRFKRRWGMLFQDGALFSSLTVAENIEVPLREHLSLPAKLRREVATLKIAMVGLAPDAANKYPAELSGGMRKRAGLARALALDPEILLLDEPTAGLDPIGAHAFDTLIRNLQRALGLTVVMVTHDLDSLAAIADRIAVLVDKRVKIGGMEELRRDPHPWIQEYFNGPRARAAFDHEGL
jgi:phospholipid/cholesterol/gamma-HCH transport system ATP-binding protein